MNIIITKKVKEYITSFSFKQENIYKLKKIVGKTKKKIHSEIDKRIKHNKKKYTDAEKRKFLFF